MSDFGAVHYGYSIYLLALCALVVLIYFRLKIIRRCHADLGLKSSYESALIRWLGLGITALLAMCCLRPYWGSKQISVTRQTHDILVAVDVSNSMLTRDVSPDRLSFVKRKIQDLLLLAKESGQADRIGLIVFAGEAHLFCPLTTDASVLRTFVNSLSPELLAVGGSRMSVAIAEAKRVIQEVKSQHPLMLIFSDGEDSEPEEVSAIGVPSFPIVFLGVGTTVGQPIEYAPSRFLRDARGQIVVSRLDEDSLKRVAAGTKGLYIRTVVGDSDLEEALQFGSSEKELSDAEGTVTVYGELAPAILLILVVLVVLSVALARPQYIFPVLLIIAVTSEAKALPELTSNLGREAAEAYEAGNFSDAEKLFSEALTKNPEDFKALQGLGSSQYRQQRYAEAAVTFQQLATKAHSASAKFNGEYNLGNAYLQGRQFDQAIAAYDRALAIRKDDIAAKTNKELAEKLKQQQSSSSSQSPSSQSSSSQSSSGSSSSSDSNQSQSSQSQSNQSQSSNGSEQSNSNSQSVSNSAGQSSSGSGSGSENSSSSADSAAPGESSGSSENSQTGEQGSSEQSSSTGKSTPSRGGVSGSMASQSQSSYDAQALKEQEARDWLNSLPDAPVLLQRPAGVNSNQGKDTW